MSVPIELTYSDTPTVGDSTRRSVSLDGPIRQGRSAFVPGRSSPATPLQRSGMSPCRTMLTVGTRRGRGHPPGQRPTSTGVAFAGSHAGYNAPVEASGPCAPFVVSSGDSYHGYTCLPIPEGGSSPSPAWRAMPSCDEPTIAHHRRCARPGGSTPVADHGGGPCGAAASDGAAAAPPPQTIPRRTAPVYTLPGAAGRHTFRCGAARTKRDNARPCNSRIPAAGTNPARSATRREAAFCGSIRSSSRTMPHDANAQSATRVSAVTARPCPRAEGAEPIAATSARAVAFIEPEGTETARTVGRGIGDAEREPHTRRDPLPLPGDPGQPGLVAVGCRDRGDLRDRRAHAASAHTPAAHLLIACPGARPGVRRPDAISPDSCRLCVSASLR